MYILEYTSRCNYAVIVAEQANAPTTLNLDRFPHVTHHVLNKKTHIFHKTWLINKIIKYVHTQYMWVVDCDFFMNFDQLQISDSILNQYKFIQPYYYSRDLTYKQTLELHQSKEPHVDCTRPELLQSRLVNIYGALSFIFDISSFVDIGAMNESYIGWGYEDYDLFFRVHGNNDSANYYINKETHGYHMYHDVPLDKETYAAENYKVLESHGYNLQNVNTILKNHYYPDWSFE